MIENPWCGTYANDFKKYAELEFFHKYTNINTWIINPDEFKVVNKIELSNIPTELNIGANDYKNEVLNQI